MSMYQVEIQASIITIVEVDQETEPDALDAAKEQLEMDVGGSVRIHSAKVVSQETS